MLFLCICVHVVCPCARHLVCALVWLWAFMRLLCAQRLNRWMCVCVGVFEGGPGFISQQISRPENPICLERQQAVHHLSWMDTISALSGTYPPPKHTHTHALYLSMTTCMKEHIQPTVTETDRHYYLRGCGGRQRQAVQLWLQSKDQETPHTNPDPDS